MLFGNKKQYEQARAAKLGKSKLAQPLEDLRRSVGEQYDVNVLHIVYDLMRGGSDHVKFVKFKDKLCI